MYIQVLSDCHLECYKRYLRIQPRANVLIMAGDIGQLHKKSFKLFLDYVSNNWEKVIYVLGNNEFYSSKQSYDKLLVEYKKCIKDYNNIFLLEKDEIFIDGYRVLGLTMWSKLKEGTKMTCPKKIKKEIETTEGIKLVKIGESGINKLHNSSVEWLKSIYDPDIPTIIITHYPLTTHPMHTRQERYRDEDDEDITEFSSDIPIQKKNKPLICISGHTHYSHDFIDDSGIRFISNQFGYPGEAKNGYTKSKKSCLYELYPISNDYTIIKGNGSNYSRSSVF